MTISQVWQDKMEAPKGRPGSPQNIFQMAKPKTKPDFKALASALATQSLRRQGIACGDVADVRRSGFGFKVKFAVGFKVSVPLLLVEEVAGFQGSVAAFLASKEGEKASLAIRGSLVPSKKAWVVSRLARPLGKPKRKSYYVRKGMRRYALPGRQFGIQVSAMLSKVVDAKPNTCWENARRCVAYLYLIGIQVKYFEGFKKVTKDPGGEAIEHGWCEFEGAVLDTTSSDTPKPRYFAIVKYSAHEVLALLSEVGGTKDSKSHPFLWKYSAHGIDNLNWKLAKERAEGGPNDDRGLFSPRHSPGQDPQESEFRVKLGAMASEMKEADFHEAARAFLGERFLEMRNRHLGLAKHAKISAGDVSHKNAKLFKVLYSQTHSTILK